VAVDIIVQKFGGTSLADAEGRGKAAGHILDAIKQGSRPLVVVSAMGREGSPYATDTLIQLARQENPEPGSRTLAFLLSCGENISAAVLALALEARGLAARPVTGGRAGIVTSDDYQEAVIQKIRTEQLLKMLEKEEVPVVTGFQGINREGEVTTLGRGGSDVTAVALGAALRASLVEIYTDVPGLMTADPRIVPEARPLSRASYSEILQMAQEGARVIHPRAVEIAMEYGVPITIRHTYEDRPGTLVSSHRTAFPGEEREKRLITGITHVKGLAQVQVDLECSEGEEKMFQALADHGVSIDLINLFPGKKVFTIPLEKQGLVEAALKDLQIEARILAGLAKITVIGAGMRGVPGIMGKIVTALKREQVPILQTADSHINISCLVREEQVQQAVCALHRIFSLERDD
jgi:aspartate kinase